MRPPLLLWMVGLLVLGCGSAGPPGSPSAALTPDPSASASPADSPSIGGQPPSPPPEASPTTSGDLALESVVEVVTEDLRVRTRPGVSDPDTMLEPLLQPGTKLFVVDGPVGDSGYRWYEVLTFDVDLTGPGDTVDDEVVSAGWVAVADRTARPWVQATTVDCPVTPSDVADLVALDSVTALACFGGMPLTLAARILDCQAIPGADVRGLVRRRDRRLLVHTRLVRPELPVPRPRGRLVRS